MYQMLNSLHPIMGSYYFYKKKSPMPPILLGHSPDSWQLLSSSWGFFLLRDWMLACVSSQRPTLKRNLSLSDPLLTSLWACLQSLICTLALSTPLFTCFYILLTWFQVTWLYSKTVGQRYEGNKRIRIMDEKISDDVARVNENWGK